MAYLIGIVILSFISRRWLWYVLLYFALMSIVVLSGCGGGDNPTQQSYTASCSDGSTRTSYVSLADAEGLCPVTYTATCGDGTVRTSSVSQAQAANLCPSFTLPGSTYDADKKSAFDRLNADRIQCGFGAVQQNVLMDQAAQNHAIYMTFNGDNDHEEVEGKPGFTGFLDESRMNYVGYKNVYTGVGEGIPEYFRWGTAFEYDSIPAWQKRWIFAAEPRGVIGTRNLYNGPYHMISILGNYREIGIGSKVADRSTLGDTAYLKYMTFNYGIPEGQVATTQAAEKLLTFPCEGITDMDPYQKNEDPDPFPNSGDRAVNPWGTPVYLRAAEKATLALTSGSITQRSTGVSVPTVQLTNANDPRRKLLSNQLFLSPTVALAENAVYDVVLIGTNSAFVSASNPTGAFDRRFSFTTSTWVGQ